MIGGDFFKQCLRSATAREVQQTAARVFEMARADREGVERDIASGSLPPSAVSCYVAWLEGCALSGRAFAVAQWVTEMQAAGYDLASRVALVRDAAGQEAMHKDSDDLGWAVMALLLERTRTRLLAERVAELEATLANRSGSQY